MASVVGFGEVVWKLVFELSGDSTMDGVGQVSQVVCVGVLFVSEDEFGMNAFDKHDKLFADGVDVWKCY